ncbi:sushi, von Willebrand factor type A, EGF and pentraxin domain-containing protein 1-like [Stylophora pistillata]|uniref:sushi, von Willebrand factor type A, EGF and pentraxin domain-containing protein 1-like n=1 Tax=Stylophora pistillata TaxID=50429 RepID=UPI000C042484|nr:sushi, von Willebrand factor type A, EGF and pentraxin domain-containing protein 1-like [Stylophora pistillata]
MLRLKGCPTTNSCKNGGVCVYDEKKQSYSCQCKPIWTAETCTDLVTCDSHPCKNRGTCRDGVNGYNCSCAPGFHGTQCEKIEGLPCSTAYRIFFEKRSTKRHTKKENAISSILSEFTVCFFVKMNDTNTNGEQCLYSYAEASSISGNGISVWLNYPKSRIGISVNKASGTDTGVGISDTMWHHICVTWKSSKGAWQLYMDGQLRSNKTGLNKNHKVPAGGTVVIGQDQDSAGGGFELSESFGPGEVTEVNLWNRVLSASDIAEQYANCHITKVGLMHWWEQFKDGVSDVTVIEP